MIPFKIMLFDMSMLRHRFSNETVGGWGALNHLPLLFYKSVYYMTNSYRSGLKKFDWFKAGL